MGPDSRQKWRPTHWPFPMAAGSPWHADRQPCRTTQVPLFTHRLYGPGWTTAWTTRWLQYPIGLYIEFQGHLELLSARCNFFCHQKCLVDLPSQRYLTPCLAGSTYCSWGSVLLLSVSRDGFSIHTYMCLWFCMFCVFCLIYYLAIYSAISSSIPERTSCCLLYATSHSIGSCSTVARPSL